MTHLIAKSARLRSTPYTKRIEEYGVQSYTVYNHMLLPASFKGIEEDSRHLKNNVQLLIPKYLLLIKHRKSSSEFISVNLFNFDVIKSEI